MVAAFLSVWIRRPRSGILASSQVEQISCFISEAWIADQIRYHDNNRRHNYRRHLFISVAAYILYGLTICAALLHIANIGSHTIETLLAFTAIIFPAVAASISAIRTHRDYLRNAMRSAEMCRHLEELKSKMILAKDYHSLAELMNETEETMLHENEDWRVAVKFQMPEIHV